MRKNDEKMNKFSEIKRKKSNQDPSDDDNSYHSDESDEGEEIDIHEYRKFLKKLYPSKHLDNKIKAGERLKNKLKNIKTKNSKKGDDNSDEDECDEDDDETVDEKGNFNIILTVGKNIDDDEDDEEWDTCSESETENEDDPISTDESEEEEQDDDNEEEDDNENEEAEEQELEDRKTTNWKPISRKNKLTNNKTRKIKPQLIKEQTFDDALLKQLIDMNSQYPNNKPLSKCVELYKTEFEKEKIKKEKKEKKEKERNGRIFRKISRDKNTNNDFNFYDKMDLEKQKKIIKELKEINKITRIEKPYRITILESEMPTIFKAAAMKKINSLRNMEPESGEYHKIKHWVDAFMRIPFGEYKKLPLTIENGVDACHEFMESAQKTLNEAVYGLNDAKMQIMQMLGQFLTNPSAIGSAIAIHGPPGTGKTSLVKNGISKILNRPFAFIALGGSTDSSFLEGHGYTYEGSTWGKIVQILIDSKCMNPVIYFDELDKISETPKGEEIVGILTHLTDTSQNNHFHDKYFTEIDFDLSKCLFIFSYNDESKVNPILRDRMYRIQTKGYNQKQKTTISTNYLLPKIREQVKFSTEDVIVPDKTIQYLIEHHCNNEDGVRNLKRCLEIIHTKLNLYRLMKPGSNLFEEDMSLKVEFPLTVTKEIVDKLIKKTELINPSLYGLYL